VTLADRFPRFAGNCPKNVNRDAKYAVRTHNGKTVVGLLYRGPDDETWHASTEDHPELVDRVNAVKTTMGGAANGPFYINEYGQVIVPAGDDAQYYLAGEYDGCVRFEFEGRVLSGEGLDLDGRALESGQAWTSPHPGIPYVLAAGGDDVYYVSHPRQDVTKKVRLSKAIGAEDATRFAAQVRTFKSSGRFYVNEWREIFAPLNGDEGVSYVYIGHLDLDEPWFPMPE
jgi:hypothetical protein